MDLEKLKIDRSAPARKRSRRRLPGPGLWVLALVVAAALVFRAPLLRLLDRLTLPEVEVVQAARTSPLAASAVAGTAANGYVVAAKRAALSADTPGRVVELNVVEGSLVKEGEVVARLYSEEYEAAVRSAQAQVEADRAALASARVDVRSAELEAVRLRAEKEAAAARVDRSQADLDLARKELARQRELVDGDVATRSALDSAVATEEGARAQLAADRASLAASEAAVAESAARKERAEAAAVEAETRITVSVAAAEQARATLEKTYVRAPFDGVVVLKDAEVGEVVSPNSQGANSRGAVATLVDLGSLEVQIDLPETLLSQVEVGDAARIFLDAYPREPYAGRVLRIWPTANRQKATVELRVGFDEPDGRLRPELGARVVFSGAEPPSGSGEEPQSDQVLVPTSAVLREDGRAGVFLVERDRVRFAPLELGEERGTRVIVRSGLEGGERVVASPPPRLTDGDRVRVAAP